MDATKTQEQLEEITIDQQTQEKIKDFYKNLKPEIKLAIVLLSELQGLDGINFQIRQKEGKLFDDIWSDLESDAKNVFFKLENNWGLLNWLSGVWEAVRMITRNI